MPGDFGKLLVLFGLILLALGLLFWLGGQFLNLGRLPGDVVIRKGNFTFYFPLMTSLVLSLLLTLLLNWLARR